MAYAIGMGLSLALLVGFFVVTNYEARRGMRFFAPLRARLDEQVGQVEFILTHVNLGAFLHGEVHRGINRIGHDIVHISLFLVRATERLLTRVVRHQHARNDGDAAPRESTRDFVKTLSDFKEQLDATHPEISDIRE